MQLHFPSSLTVRQNKLERFSLSIFFLANIIFAEKAGRILISSLGQNFFTWKY